MGSVWICKYVGGWVCECSASDEKSVLKRRGVIKIFLKFVATVEIGWIGFRK